MYGTAQLQGKTSCVKYTRVARKFLTSQLANMPWLLAIIIVKYINIISRVLAQNTTGNFIVTNGHVY